MSMTADEFADLLREEPHAIKVQKVLNDFNARRVRYESNGVSFIVRIEKCPDEEGWTAVCDKLGLVTEGENILDLVNRVHEIAPTLIDMYFQDMKNDGSNNRQKAISSKT